MSTIQGLNSPNFPTSSLEVRKEKFLWGYLEFINNSDNYATLRVYKKGSYFHAFIWANGEKRGIAKNKDLNVCIRDAFISIGVDTPVDTVESVRKLCSKLESVYVKEDSSIFIGTLI